MDWSEMDIVLDSKRLIEQDPEGIRGTFLGPEHCRDAPYVPRPAWMLREEPSGRIAWVLLDWSVQRFLWSHEISTGDRVAIHRDDDGEGEWVTAWDVEGELILNDPVRASFVQVVLLSPY